MDTDTLKYNIVTKIKDERFEIDNLHNYVLLIQIGYDNMQICIIDGTRNICLLLEDFKFKASNQEELSGVIQKIFDEHSLLMAGFWKSVKLSFKNNKFTLVPSPLFLKDHVSDYLRLNCEFDPKKEEVHFYKHISCNLINIFAINKPLLQWIKNTYPNLHVHYFHQSSSIIEGILQNKDHMPSMSMFLVVENSVLHITVSKNKYLVYYNQFKVQSPADIVKYTMIVVKELRLDPNSLKVLVWGNIFTTSKGFKELYKYLRHISFGNKPNYLKFSYFFDELEDHQYFDVYNMYTCD